MLPLLSTQCMQYTTTQRSIHSVQAQLTTLRNSHSARTVLCELRKEKFLVLAAVSWAAII
jgi:hypothetical protein